MSQLPNVQHADFLHTILERVADHMSALSETLSATEDFMTEHFHDILKVKPHAMADFQKLDYLNQSIIDTAKLLKHLSLGCSDHSALLEKLQLESTQNLVVPPIKSDEDQKASGEFHLF